MNISFQGKNKNLDVVISFPFPFVKKYSLQPHFEIPNKKRCITERIQIIISSELFFVWNEFEQCLRNQEEDFFLIYNKYMWMYGT